VTLPVKKEIPLQGQRVILDGPGITSWRSEVTEDEGYIPKAMEAMFFRQPESFLQLYGELTSAVKTVTWRRCES
jgi:hypothetical protein